MNDPLSSQVLDKICSLDYANQPTNYAPSQTFPYSVRYPRHIALKPTSDHLSHSIAAFFVISLVYWLFGTSSPSSGDNMGSISHKYEYEAVTGYFLQDDPKTDPDTFEYVCYRSAATLPHI